MKIEKFVNKDSDPINFERPLSKAVYWRNRGWSRDLPRNVQLSTDALYMMNRSFEPQAIEEASRAVLEPLCAHRGLKARIELLPHSAHKKQLKGFIVYADNLCERASEILFPIRPEKSQATVGEPRVTTTNLESVLRDLDSMLDEEDETDFRNTPSAYAHQLARQIISDTHTHYVGASPIPGIAPDGEGGLVVEWKRDKLIVRLIISTDKNGRSYIYSRGPHRSVVERSISGMVLAQELSTVFAT